MKELTQEEYDAADKLSRELTPECEARCAKNAMPPCQAHGMDESYFRSIGNYEMEGYHKSKRIEILRNDAIAAGRSTAFWDQAN